MDEKVILLTEETGCDQGEAELALELVNYDLEKAIKTIRTLLENVIAIKGKFIIPEENIYGLFISIFDMRTENIVRTRVVTSYNPTIYEINLNTDWYLIEKLTYSYRLGKGSIPNLAYEIEKSFHTEITKKKEMFYSTLSHKDKDKIQEILITNFPKSTQVSMQTTIEEINLEEYSDESTKSETEKPSPIDNANSKKVFLETELCQYNSGKKATHLKKGDVVLVQITDNRDIGKYLAHLLGTKDNLFFPAPIHQITHTDSGSDIQLNFTSGIVGFCRLNPQDKIKVIKQNSTPWWKKLFLGG